MSVFTDHLMACRRTGFGLIDSLISARNAARFEATQVCGIADTRAPADAIVRAIEHRNCVALAEYRAKREARVVRRLFGLVNPPPPKNPSGLTPRTI